MQFHGYLAQCNKKRRGLGERTQFTSNTSAVTNDLQPLHKNYIFDVKANKISKKWLSGQELSAGNRLQLKPFLIENLS